MKKITIEIKNNVTEIAGATVKSEGAMWNFLRKVRDQLTDKDLEAKVQVVATLEDGTAFKDITFRKNSKGKIEMPNAVKETNRVRMPVEKKEKEETTVLEEAKTMAAE